MILDVTSGLKMITLFHVSLCVHVMTSYFLVSFYFFRFSYCECCYRESMEYDHEVMVTNEIVMFYLGVLKNFIYILNFIHNIFFSHECSQGKQSNMASLPGIILRGNMVG
jgi:hypothetical protein